MSVLYKLILQRDYNKLCFVIEKPPILSWFRYINDFESNYKKEKFILTLPFYLETSNSQIIYAIRQNFTTLRKIKKSNYSTLSTPFYTYIDGKFFFYENGCLLELETCTIENTIIVKKILFCTTIPNNHLGILLKDENLFERISTPILEQGTFFIDSCLNTKPYLKIKNTMKKELNTFSENFFNTVTIPNLKDFLFTKETFFVPPPVKNITEKNAMYNEMFLEAGFLDAECVKEVKEVEEVKEETVVADEYSQFLNSFQDE